MNNNKKSWLFDDKFKKSNNMSQNNINNIRMDNYIKYSKIVLDNENETDPLNKIINQTILDNWSFV